MLLTEEESKNLIKKILSFSRADSAFISLNGSNSNNVRFAVNTVSTCGAINSINATITSNFGKKSGRVRITNIDDKIIQRGVESSETIARLTPDNEEFMPPLKKQDSYLKVNGFFDDTSNLSPQNISEKISYIIKNSVEKELLAAGYFEKEAGFLALGNTNGLFSYHKNTHAGFSSTVRTKNGKGSSKIQRAYADINLLDMKNISDKVIERSILSQDPKEYPPGKYVTILDSAAVSDMVEILLYNMSRRSADEGRSFFAEEGKDNKIDQRIVNPKVNIYSDPQSNEAPSTPFAEDGHPMKKTRWITKGILENLYSGRYWAKKTNSEYIPYPSNILMSGSDKSVEELISSTENGIYVTRFWYIRTLDPQQLLMTGLTRDGVFLIKNGKIKDAINNYRFNESPINILNNIVDMSIAERIGGSESEDSKIVVPALKLSEFNFSTVSDAI